MRKQREITNWREDSLRQDRERLQNQSALNRLGQGNSGGVQRTPPRRGPDPRSEDARERDRFPSRW